MGIENDILILQLEVKELKTILGGVLSLVPGLLDQVVGYVQVDSCIQFFDREIQIQKFTRQEVILGEEIHRAEDAFKQIQFQIKEIESNIKQIKELQSKPKGADPYSISFTCNPDLLKQFEKGEADLKHRAKQKKKELKDLRDKLSDTIQERYTFIDSFDTNQYGWESSS